jgi:hypothetical protein
MTKLITVKEVLSQVIVNAATEREKALALHDYVRERVKFGFNKYFDATPLDYLLSCGYGHCNPKSRLMVELFRVAGIESYQHFVVVPKEILKDAIPPSRYWMIPKELCHSYVEVKVEGQWCSIESFIVDTPLLKSGRARLAKENRSLGYGVHLDSTNTWDGRGNAFSQFSPSMLVEDHGRVENLQAYFKEKKYRHFFLGVPFNSVFKLMGEAGVAPMNIYIEKIRQQNDRNS